MLSVLYGQEYHACENMIQPCINPRNPDTTATDARHHNVHTVTRCLAELFHQHICEKLDRSLTIEVIHHEGYTLGSCRRATRK
jgi:hypothetical protein